MKKLRISNEVILNPWYECGSFPKVKVAKWSKEINYLTSGQECTVYKKTFKEIERHTKSGDIWDIKKGFSIKWWYLGY